MADSVAVDLAVEQPDWCAVAREAVKLARFLQERLPTHGGRMTGLSETPASLDPALSRLYRLSEEIVEAITARAPDWCAIAPSARELADLIEQRCVEARGE